jgi:signal transduction histidine kinase
MSLRFRIILLFVGLAIVPLLTLAAFSYWQSQSLLTGAVHAHLSETAGSLRSHLEVRSSEIEDALRALARSGLMEQGLGGGENEGDLGAASDPWLRRAEFLEVSGPMASSPILLGSIPENPVRMTGQGSSTLLEFAFALPETEGGISVRAAFWASDLLPVADWASNHSVALLDATTGRVLFSQADRTPMAEDCGKVFPGFSEAMAGSATPSRGFKFKDQGESRFGAVEYLPHRGWAVVAASSSSAALASLNRLVAAYWAFVLGLALFTGLAFYIFLGRFTKSLRELTRAAEHIGTGELNPWLPLPTDGEVGQLTLAFNRMLERLREMMGQVDRSGRLAVVGQLSAYFAHEIRNPLTSIKLNLQRLKRWTDQDKLPEFCLEPLEISLREVERLSASVSDVLQLSRSQDSPRDVFSLHDQVEESAHLLMARFMGQGVELRLDLDAEADLVLARPGQVKSVILNLMVNALEAQPKGGFLEVSSGLTRSTHHGGPAVALRFRDGGPGIPLEIRDRIFEPFFTTKQDGSGIGLAVASRAVRDNHGRLYLGRASELNSGAEFVMTFPLAAIEPNAVPVGEKTRFARALRIPEVKEVPQVGGGPTPERPGVPVAGGIPRHLMTTEGMEAVMALSTPDPEDIN